MVREGQRHKGKGKGEEDLTDKHVTDERQQNIIVTVGCVSRRQRDSQVGGCWVTMCVSLPFFFTFGLSLCLKKRDPRW